MGRKSRSTVEEVWLVSKLRMQGKLLWDIRELTEKSHKYFKMEF